MYRVLLLWSHSRFPSCYYIPSQSGVIHRDLKPENLLVANDFLLKISDFGWAGGAFVGQGAMQSTFCGTAAYMAPELLARQQYNGQSVDVFAAGCVIFIMLTGGTC